MWLNKDNISLEAFWYCLNTNDDPKIRKHITYSYFAYRYCYEIKNCPEMRKRITIKEQLKHLERKDKQCG